MTGVQTCALPISHSVHLLGVGFTPAHKDGATDLGVGQSEHSILLATVIDPHKTIRPNALARFNGSDLRAFTGT